MFILEGGLFGLIVRVIFTIFNINIPFFISWKPNVVLFHLDCHRWSNNLLDVKLIEVNNLGWCQTRNLFFVVPVWFMTYFHLLPFFNDKQYGEGEMSQAVVIVYFFLFFLHLLFLLRNSVEHDQPLLHLSIPCLFPLTLILCSLLYFLIFVILGWSLLKAKLKVDLHTALSPCVWRQQLIRRVV